MVFGGIPYYLDPQERGMSLAQNVDALLFTRGGQLVPEFDRLYATLFRNPAPYVAAVRALSRKRMGMTRSELSAAIDLDDSGLTKVLRDLDLSTFPGVDASRLAVLGICGGGGYALMAAFLLPAESAAP